MKTKPILFNTEMVRAILEGRKTQTRRIVKPHYHDNECGYNVVTNAQTGAFCYIEYYDWDERSTERRLKPPYIPGDILWVREAWCNLPVSPGGHTRLMRGRYYYKADEPDIRPDGWKRGWKPSIHMPKEAARVFLRVTDVRVERIHKSFFRYGNIVHNISAEGIGIGDQCRECIETYGNPCCIDEESECGVLDDIRDDFARLWDSTVKKADLPVYGWEADPWVWVIEFEKTEKPEGWPCTEKKGNT